MQKSSRSCQTYKDKFVMLLFNGSELLSWASDEAKSLPKYFSKKSNLEGSGTPSPVFSSRPKLKLCNISVTLKIVKKVIINLDLSKASGPDCIPVVFQKNCEPELFNMCLKRSFFPNSWKVSLAISVFKNAGKRSTAKNYDPFSLLSVVSKVFEKVIGLLIT